MKKLYFTIAALLLPIAGHGIMAISENEDARFFLHWSMLLATLIGSGLGLLIVKSIAVLRAEHDICEDLLFFAIINSLIPMADTSCSICTLYCCDFYSRWSCIVGYPRLASAENQFAGKVKQ